jgi:hypothetical protein
LVRRVCIANPASSAHHLRKWLDVEEKALANLPFPSPWGIAAACVFLLFLQPPVNYIYLAMLSVSMYLLFSLIFASQGVCASRGFIHKCPFRIASLLRVASPATDCACSCGAKFG